MHGVSEPIPRKGSGDAQPPSSDFASVRDRENAQELTPDPLRGIGSVIAVYARWFREFPPRASLRKAYPDRKQRNFKTRKLRLRVPLTRHGMEFQWVPLACALALRAGTKRFRHGMEFRVDSPRFRAKARGTHENAQ